MRAWAGSPGQQSFDGQSPRARRWAPTYGDAADRAGVEPDGALELVGDREGGRAAGLELADRLRGELAQDPQELLGPEGVTDRHVGLARGGDGRQRERRRLALRKGDAFADQQRRQDVVRE